MASDAFDAHSGVRVVRAAIVSAQRIRFSTFLASIEAAEAQINDSERQRLRDYVDSDLGKETLLDYSQAVIRTQSRIAIVALGLLFPRPDDARYPPRFRRLACEVLEGVSDEDVSAFLAFAALADDFITEATGSGGDLNGIPQFTSVTSGMVRGAGPGKGPYVVVGADGDFAANRVGLSPAAAYASCERLQSRAILLRDFVDGGYGGSSYLTFGLSDDHERFRSLLSRARDLLGDAAPATS